MIEITGVISDVSKKCSSCAYRLGLITYVVSPCPKCLVYFNNLNKTIFDEVADKNSKEKITPKKHLFGLKK